MSNEQKLEDAINTLAEVGREDAERYALDHAKDLRQVRKDLRLVRLGLTFLWRAVFGPGTTSFDAEKRPGMMN